MSAKNIQSTRKNHSKLESIFYSSKYFTPSFVVITILVQRDGTSVIRMHVRLQLFVRLGREDRDVEHSVALTKQGEESKRSDQYCT